jgi:F420-0:gamma-glutamyl ligase
MNKKETTRILNNNKELLLIHQKVVDKLEQRIFKLEKVLSSHAKCIGELRGTELRIHDLKDNQFEINADGTETTKDSIL